MMDGNNKNSTTKDSINSIIEITLDEWGNEVSPFESSNYAEQSYPPTEEEEDPSDELSMEDIERCARDYELAEHLKTRCLPPCVAKEVYDDPKFDMVNDLLNNRNEDEAWTDLLSQIPECYVDLHNGRRFDAFKAVTHYMNDTRSRHRNQMLVQSLRKIVEDVKATPEEQQKCLENLADALTLNSKDVQVKQEMFDEVNENVVDIQDFLPEEEICEPIDVITLYDTEYTDSEDDCVIMSSPVKQTSNENNSSAFQVESLDSDDDSVEFIPSSGDTQAYKQGYSTNIDDSSLPICTEQNQNNVIDTITLD